MYVEEDAKLKESLESFCYKASEQLLNKGFDIDIQPGTHIVNDSGADSLAILHYAIFLKDFGLNVDLLAFDISLLNINVAYMKWNEEQYSKA